MNLGGLLRALRPAPPPVVEPVPIIETNDPVGPHGTGYGYYAAAGIDSLEPEDGFPVLVVNGRRAL